MLSLHKSIKVAKQDIRHCDVKKEKNVVFVSSLLHSLVGTQKPQEIATQRSFLKRVRLYMHTYIYAYTHPVGRKKVTTLFNQEQLKNYALHTK